MATTTQPTVLNLLIQKFNSLAPFALSPGSEEAYIVDGSPGPNMPDNLIAVMPWPNDTSRGTEEWEDTSGGRLERYAIQVRIRSYVGGAADPNSLSTAQSAARANASVMQAAIEGSLLADLNLANENEGSQVIIQFGDTTNPPWEIDYYQTNIDDDDGKGRYAEYLMTLNIFNYLAGAG